MFPTGKIKISILSGLLLALSGAGVAWSDFEKGFQAYERGDFNTAYREWRPAADKGDPYAQHMLGFLYANGRGVPLKPGETAQWIGRAADAGYPDAQYDYGIMHATGEGVDSDLGTAYMWLDLAADTRGLQPGVFWKNIDKLLTPTQRLEADRLKKTWE